MKTKLTTWMLISIVLQGCFTYQREYEYSGYQRQDYRYSVEISPKRTNMDWKVIGNELHLSIKRVNKPTDHFKFRLDDLYASTAATWYIEDGESIMRVKSYKVIDSDRFSFIRCNYLYTIKIIREG